MNLFLVEAKVQLVHLLRKFRFIPFTFIPFFICLTILFRLKPYGDMPKEISWDVGAFIGQAEYKIRVESRDI